MRCIPLPQLVVTFGLLLATSSTGLAQQPESNTGFYQEELVPLVEDFRFDELSLSDDYSDEGEWTFTLYDLENDIPEEESKDVCPLDPQDELTLCQDLQNTQCADGDSQDLCLPTVVYITDNVPVADECSCFLADDDCGAVIVKEVNGGLDYELSCNDCPMIDYWYIHINGERIYSPVYRSSWTTAGDIITCEYSTSTCPGIEEESACPRADINGDGVADGLDIAELRGYPNWLNTIVEPGTNPCADVNRDGFIDGLDIAEIRNTACWGL